MTINKQPWQGLNWGMPWKEVLFQYRNVKRQRIREKCSLLGGGGGRSNDLPCPVIGLFYNILCVTWSKLRKCPQRAYLYMFQGQPIASSPPSFHYVDMDRQKVVVLSSLCGNALKLNGYERIAIQAFFPQSASTHILSNPYNHLERYLHIGRTQLIALSTFHWTR